MPRKFAAILYAEVAGYRLSWGNVVLMYGHIYWVFKSDRLLKNISVSAPALETVFKF